MCGIEVRITLSNQRTSSVHQVEMRLKSEGIEAFSAQVGACLVRKQISIKDQRDRKHLVSLNLVVLITSAH